MSTRRSITGQWTVVAYRYVKKDKWDEQGRTWVRADDEENALAIGRAVLRGRVRGKFSCSAYPYDPSRDRALHGFVREVEPEPFTLENEPARAPRPVFSDQENTRQRKLIDGLDCLPGQRDLFLTTGAIP